MLRGGLCFGNASIIQSYEANRCSRWDQLTHRAGRAGRGLQHQALQSSPYRLLGNDKLSHQLAALQLPRNVGDPVAFRLTVPSPTCHVESSGMGDPGFPAPSLPQKPDKSAVTPRVFPFMENVEIQVSFQFGIKPDFARLKSSTKWDDCSWQGFTDWCRLHVTEKSLLNGVSIRISWSVSSKNTINCPTDVCSFAGRQGENRSGAASAKRHYDVVGAAADLTLSSERSRSHAAPCLSGAPGPTKPWRESLSHVHTYLVISALRFSRCSQ